MRENKGVSWTQIGLGKAFELAALGIQAARGDIKREKPSFINIPGTIIYNNQMKLKGMSKEQAQDLTILETEKLHK